MNMINTNEWREKTDSQRVNSDPDAYVGRTIIYTSQQYSGVTAKQATITGVSPGKRCLRLRHTGEGAGLNEPWYVLRYLWIVEVLPM